MPSTHAFSHPITSNTPAEAVAEIKAFLDTAIAVLKLDVKGVKVTLWAGAKHSGAKGPPVNGISLTCTSEDTEAAAVDEILRALCVRGERTSAADFRAGLRAFDFGEAPTAESIKALLAAPTDPPPAQPVEVVPGLEEA